MPFGIGIGIPAESCFIPGMSMPAIGSFFCCADAPLTERPNESAIAIPSGARAPSDVEGRDLHAALGFFGKWWNLDKPLGH